MIWMIDVRVSIARRSGIKVATRALELSRAVGFFVNVYRVFSRLQHLRVSREFKYHLYYPLLAMQFNFNKIRVARYLSITTRNVSVSAHDLLALCKLVHPSILSPKTVKFQHALP